MPLWTLLAVLKILNKTELQEPANQMKMMICDPETSKRFVPCGMKKSGVCKGCIYTFTTPEGHVEHWVGKIASTGYSYGCTGPDDGNTDLSFFITGQVIPTIIEIGLVIGVFINLFPPIFSLVN